MLQSLSRYWWVLVVRGLISIAFAVFAFLNPKAAFATLVLALGAFLLADGLLALYLGANMRKSDRDWWMVLLEGLLGVGLGILTFINPDITASGILLFIALWCMVTGVFEISAAIRLREEIDNEWLLGLAGAVSVALGVLILINPTAGAFSLTMWIGFYALMFGGLLVGLGLRVKKAGNA
jgi:uncharacterized membrane protein HdeD (DUF308 family)